MFNPFRSIDQQADTDERQRRGTLVVQALPILLIPVFVSLITIFLLVISNQVTPVGPPSGAKPLIPIAALIVFFSALIVLVRLGRPTISAIVLIGVWTLITTFASLQSGVTSYLPALLIVPICAAGLLIDRVASLSLAALATILVGSMGWLEMHGYAPQTPIPPPAISQNLPYLATGFWVGLFWTIAGLTSLLAGGLYKALQRSRAQAAELERLRDQLEARVESQTKLILEQERNAATLEERSRLAREIHDTIAQGLAGVVLQIGAVQRAMSVAPTEAPTHLELAQRMARESLAEARRSVWNLRSPVLEQAELADALRGVVERQIALLPGSQFNLIGEPHRSSANIESALLRVVQEALANAARYAQSAVIVEMHYLSEGIRLMISDSGPGFSREVLDQPITPGPWGGFGLLGMRERIAALGGELKLYNNPGAIVEVFIPEAET